jgi:hypothetical protein
VAGFQHYAEANQSGPWIEIAVYCAGRYAVTVSRPQYPQIMPFPQICQRAFNRHYGFDELFVEVKAAASSGWHSEFQLRCAFQFRFMGTYYPEFISAGKLPIGTHCAVCFGQIQLLLLFFKACVRKSGVKFTEVARIITVCLILA